MALSSINAAALEITTLGRFRVRAGDRDASGLRRQPVRAALLVYLAMEREATRDTLVGMFWPDLTEKRARNALSQSLHRLRCDLGQWAWAEGEAVVVAESVTIDARTFEQALERGDTAGALELYAGEFLAGWRLLESHEIQLWTDRQRARLSRLHDSAMATRIRELEDAGEVVLAIAAARRRAELSPLAEDAQAALIRLLAGSGARSEARRQYRSFASALAAEDMELSPALADRLDRLVADSPPTSAAAALPRPCVLVEPFRNRTGCDELQSLGPMIADWIIEGLDRTGLVSITPLLEPLSVAPASRQSAAAEPHGAAAPPRFLIRGSYYLMSGALEVRGEVLDPDSGVMAGTMNPLRTGADDTEAAVAGTRDRILGLLAAILDPDWTGLPSPPELGSRPPTFEAYQAYARGMDYFLREEYSRAIPELEEAHRLDEATPRPLLLAAAAHGNLGEWERVGPLLDRLDALADRLSPYEAGGLGWHRARLRGDCEEAYVCAIRAWRRYPGTIAHFVAGVAALEINRPQETIEIFRALDPSRGWIRHFQPYWALLTAACHVLGRHDVERETAWAGRCRFPLLLTSVACEVRALAAVGDLGGLEDALSRAMALPSQSGWSWGRVAQLAALELRAHGWPAEAAAHARMAADWFRQMARDIRPSAGAHADLAHSLYLAGEWTEAGALFRDLAAEFPASVDHAGHLGVLAARGGDFGTAAVFDQRLENFGQPFLFGRDKLWRARIAAQQGQTGRAIGLLRRAFAEGRGFGVELHTDVDLEPLREDPAYREFVRPKG